MNRMCIPPESLSRTAGPTGAMLFTGAVRRDDGGKGGGALPDQDVGGQGASHIENPGPRRDQ